MTYLLSCACGPPDTTCSFEEAVKAVLKAAPEFMHVEVYTGDLATQTDTGNVGPKVPFVILSDLGANNSLRVGESFIRHEVILRLRIYATTDAEGLSLARAAQRALRAAGPIETLDGYACQSPIVARARPLKLDSNRWMIQVNQVFFIHELIT